MFVLNIKLNTKKILITCLIVCIIVASVIEIINYTKIKKRAFDFVLNETNFTTVLKQVHDNIDGNIGKKIKLSGFIFTMPDFKQTYFVCGRNMLLSGEEKVVGFLCDYADLNTLSEAEWVEIEGVIIKGYYISDMPVIKVKKLTKITAPENTFVEALSANNI